jgi:ATP-dependent Clp protease adaptor protein ClpS
MLYVHHQGVGVAGVYSFEIAEMKARKTEELAREHEFPLKLTLEPEDD